MSQCMERRSIFPLFWVSLFSAGLDRADADLVRSATGFAIGGVAPIAHATAIDTYIDSALGEHSVIWAAAGHPHAVFPTSFTELVAITGGKVIEVAEQ